MAWASSRLSSSVFIVTNLSTNKFSEAATIASPNSMNISANITYSGFLFSALSFCKATISPKPEINYHIIDILTFNTSLFLPIVVKVIKQ